MKMPRSFKNAAVGGMLAVALFAGSAASCTPDEYPVTGSEPTEQVCTDLGSALPPIYIGIATNDLIQAASDPNPTPNEQVQAVKATQSSWGQLSDALRAEAAVAADPGLAAALADTADGVDAQAANIHTYNDISRVDDQPADFSKLDPYCPDLHQQLVFNTPSG